MSRNRTFTSDLVWSLQVIRSGFQALMEGFRRFRRPPDSAALRRRHATAEELKERTGFQLVFMVYGRLAQRASHYRISVIGLARAVEDHTYMFAKPESLINRVGRCYTRRNA